MGGLQCHRHHPGITIPIRSLSCDKYPTEGNAVSLPLTTSTKSINATLQWDIAADYPEGHSREFRIEGRVIPKLYMAVDLTTGAVTYPGLPPSHYPEEQVKGTHMWFRYILPGKFMLGSPAGESAVYENDETQHPVEVTDGYYMGIYEVTQKQYQLITGTNPSHALGDYRPVDSVTNYDLRANPNTVSYTMFQPVGSNSFLGKLRAKSRLDFDLPTEAQWERACRADSIAPLSNGRALTNPVQCPELDKLGRYSGNLNDGKGGYNGAHTTVGSYECNAFGLYDTHGNVMEYCMDNFHDFTWWYTSVPNWQTTLITNPIAVYKDYPWRCYVIKGGAFDSTANRCRSASRFEIQDYNEPLAGYEHDGGIYFLEHKMVGFRVVYTQRGAFGEGGGADLILAQYQNAPYRIDLRPGEAGRIVTYNDAFSTINYDLTNSSSSYTVNGGSTQYASSWLTNQTGWFNVVLSEKDQPDSITSLLGLHSGLVRRGTFTGNKSWSGATTNPNSNIHVITHWVKVAANATLTIENGAIVKFAPGTGILVEGTLNANGVTFTALADNDPSRGPITTYDPANPTTPALPVPITHQFQAQYPIVATGNGTINIQNSSYWYQSTVKGEGITATGDSANAVGQNATATAEPPPDGYTVYWESPDLPLTRNQATQSTLTYTMPHTDVRLTASLRKIYYVQVENASVTLSNGENGNGQYFAGETLTLTANLPPDAQFLGWEVQGLTLSAEELTQPTLAITMPEQDLRVIAHCGVLHEFTLNAGWNLMALPGTLTPDTPDEILLALLAYGLDENGHFAPVPIAELTPLKGYWIYSPTTTTIQVAGPAGNATQLPTLTPGWNLAGGNGELPQENYRVYKLDNARDKLIPGDRTPDGNWMLQPGTGYYIYAK